EIELHANPALYDRARLATLRDGLARILEAFIAQPAQPLRAYAVLDDATLAQVVQRWSARAEPVAIRTWPAMLAAQMARDPAAEALRFRGESCTYGQLDTASNTLAHALIRRGVGPGDIVALALPRGTAMVRAMLAVGKAGGAILPLDIRQPAARLRATLDQASPKLVLAAAESAEWLAAAALPSLRLDDPALDAEIAAGPRHAIGDAERIAALSPDHPAYVIFTSGTTGAPKGAVLPHRGLQSLLESLLRQADLGPQSRILQFSAPSFDVMVAEVMMAFAGGGCLIIAPEEARHGAALERILREEAITHAVIPPAALAGLDPARVGALPVLLVGGEASPPALVARWAPGRRMINVYGPTETTFCVTLSEPMQPGEPVLLGRPILGARLLVLDGWGRPVAPGAAGELHIGGAGVGLGYLNAPDLTQERFYSAPADGAWFFRTGDRVRWHDQGMLEFLGRTDDQIKLRGFRIEPDEIARLLERQPGVREARVIARHQPPAVPGDAVAEAAPRRLLGYVLPQDGASLSGAALRAALARLLPDYMVPAAIMEVSAWPLTAHGKLDRAALPEPSFRPQQMVAPRTPLEAKLAALMAEVLRLETLSVEDSFFELGGDSLLATMLSLRIKAELGHEIGLGDLFNAPSPAQLANHIQN
ncbi:non-ribosomal peptide synthetase, partial [Acidisoma sp. C75]